MPTHDFDPFDEVGLVDRYFAGQASPADAARIAAWLENTPEQIQVMHAMRTALTHVAREVPRRDGRQVLSEILAGTQHGTRQYAGSPTNARGAFRRAISWRPETLRYGVWYTLAGVVAGMLVIVAGMRIDLWHSSRSHAHPVLAYATENGQRAHIPLPDGSTVVLGVASRLDVPTDYLAGNHTVRLMGEAVFLVRHTDGVPLTVLAGSATTRVLGTSFRIRHYATDPVTTIAVRDGKVAVHAATDQPVVVGAAQQVQVGPTGTGRVQPTDLTRFSFMRGLLVLKGMPMPDAIVELNRWYDADIRLGDSALAAQRITGEFAADSLSDLTEILELMFHVRVVRSGRVLTLYPR